MYKPSIEEMFSGRESRYALVIGVAKRAREITEKSFNKKTVLVDKPVLLAAKDFKNDKYTIIGPDIND